MTKAIETTNAKTYVFADSVPCLGSISDQPVEAWRNKIKCYSENRYLKDLNRIDGEPMEFEWKKFSGFTTLGILEEILNMMTESKCEPEQFEGRIIFNDRNIGRTRKHRKNVRRILLQLRIMLEDSRSDVGHFWDLHQRRNGTELILINQMETGTRLLNE